MAFDLDDEELRATRELNGVNKSKNAETVRKIKLAMSYLENIDCMNINIAKMNQRKLNEAYQELDNLVGSLK